MKEDWAKKYADMDKRMQLKCAQLPDGEQIGKQRPILKQEPKKDKKKARLAAS